MDEIKGCFPSYWILNKFSDPNLNIHVHPSRPGVRKGFPTKFNIFLSWNIAERMASIFGFFKYANATVTSTV